MIDKEKRHSRRFAQGVPIEIGYLSAEKLMGAQTLNYCTEGMCFLSRTPLKPGTGILIKVVHWKWDASSPDVYEGLRTMTFGKVKWCTAHPGEIGTDFEVGVKYFSNPY